MAVNLSPYGGVGAQFLDNSGNVLTGGKIFTYAAGTTTNQATYTNATGTIPHPNPIILDAAGRVPGGEIWLTDGLQYKFVLKDSNDVLIATYDNVIGINSNFVNYATQQEVQTATAGQTVFTLNTITYTPGTNSLSVYVDGVNQYDGVSYAYVETDSTTVTFTSGLHVGALVKFTTAVTLSSGVTTADLVSYDPPFTGGVPTTVENKLAQTVSVMDFGAAGDGVTDDTVAIQNAIDSGAGEIFFPKGIYKTTAPIYIDGGITLSGENSNDSIIKKTTATVGAGSNTSRGGAVTDSYAVNAILIFRHLDESFTYGTVIKGIKLFDDGYIVDYGIYAPRSSRTLLEDVEILQCRIGWFTYDSWLCKFTNVVCNSNTQRFNGNNYGWPDANPSYGFVWENDGTNSATGTTLVADSCGARDCHYGWFLYGLQYSVLNGCGADNISFRAWRLFLSNLTLNGCGMENVYAAQSALSIEGGQTVINNFNAFGIFGGTNPNTAMAFIDGTKVTMEGCRLDNFTLPGAAANIVIQNGTTLVTSNTTFPTNGTTFISYTGGSQWVDTTTVPPLIRTADRAAYVPGDVRGNQLQQKTNKAILSAGSVIATFTTVISNVSYGVCEFTVSWFDGVYPSAAGIDKFLVTVYQDTLGATYRQDITIIAQSEAGNTGGAVIPPTYTLSRVGSVWSLTMTPAHGDCTAYTITAEMQNISGITLALP